jgi:ubiquinone/menaquinone biosynthesis C-methylase UbiE
MADDLEDLAGLLDEQATYYRDRAPEYDQWWLRQGPYDRGEGFNAAWRAEVEELRAIVDAFQPQGDVLEIAAGTGIWTAELAHHRCRIHAVDQSAETLELNRARLASAVDAVRYEQADVFAWRPDRRYDVVFFSFWLSHVPPSRFDAFWETVAAALAPGGRVLLLDNAAPEESQQEVAGIDVRRLNDGREYRIVKVHWTAEELQERLGDRGWRFDGGRTARFFTYATGTRPG